MSVYKCSECHEYVAFLKAQGKEAPAFLGSCLPFRLSSGDITSLCNAPAGEKSDFINWTQRDEEDGVPGGMSIERFQEFEDSFGND